MALAFALLPRLAHATPTDSLRAPRSVPNSTQDDGEGCQFTVIKGLNFGAMFTSASPGTIVLNTSSIATYTGGVYGHTGVPGYAPQAAEIELNLDNPTHCEEDDHCSNDNNEYDRNEDDDNQTNDCNSNFTRHGMTCQLSISNSSTLTRVGGTETMTADTYNFTRTKGDISIGATLHVNANQKSGSYSGNFYVTLDYN